MAAHVAIEPSTAATPKVKRCRGGRRSRIGETTGECAAVCCCCPCAVVHLFVLALYRLPAGIWRRKRRKMILSRMKKNPREKKEDRHKSAVDEASRGGDETYEGENDAVGWDNEMWRRFYGRGFWRTDDES